MLGGVLLYVLLGVAIITLRYIERLLEGKSVWAEWEGDPGGFCEGLADRADDFVREPVNAWSAMVYFVAGLAITLVALKCVHRVNIRAYFVSCCGACGSSE